MRRAFVLAIALASLSAFLPAATASAQDRQGGTFLWAQLMGSAEVPGPGDSVGAGGAFVIIGKDGEGQYNVCFALAVTGLENVTAAHIHPGTAAEAGNPIIPFQAPEPVVSGCAKADLALGDQIVANPAAYYVNVHTRTYPGGAIRGQLMPMMMDMMSSPDMMM